MSEVNLLFPNADYGLAPIESGGGLFCGCTEEQFAINGRTYSWGSVRKLRWGFAFSKLGNLGFEDIRDAIEAALAEISGCCDMQHEYVSNANAGVNLLITQRRLDGSSGVLADCQIPVGNVSPDTQLLMRFDDSENWLLSDTPRNGIDFYRVFLHEALHGHGLGHKPANVRDPALIQPMYSPTMRHLQEADKEELRRRYGPAKAKPVTPAPSAPGALGKPVTISVEQDGKVWSGSIPRTK